MKKKIAMLLAAALCMGTFAGCGNSTSNNSSAADNNTTNNTAAATESSDVTASADNDKDRYVKRIFRSIQRSG